MLSSLINLPVPVLLNFESDYRRLKQYQEENDRLKQQVSQDVITLSVRETGSAYMGSDVSARKPVFGICEQVKLKPAC